MFARITTFNTADPSHYWGVEQIHRLMVRSQEVLREMDGYESSHIFIDRQNGKVIAITLWKSKEAMNRSEEAVRPLRKEMAGGLATNMVDVGHYEVGRPSSKRDASERASSRSLG